VRTARGRTGSHHLTYELALGTGEILRTRISHPVDRTTYGASLWAHILRDQLQVEDAVFWACVMDKVKPARGVAPEVPPAALPARVIHQLLKAGIPEPEVKDMTRDEALRRLEALWNAPPDSNHD
jgi:hypothetical protein